MQDMVRMDADGHRRACRRFVLSARPAAGRLPRGTLDKAYCDRDGNLTADLRAIRRKSSSSN